MQKPDGLTVIKPHQIKDFLRGLPVNKIWGVGPVTHQQLKEKKITTVEQLRQLSLIEMQRLWGKRGLRLYQLARGVDKEPVDPSEDRKSVSRETTFAQDLFSGQQMEEELTQLSGEVCQVLTTERLKGRKVTLKVRYADFQIQTRSYSQSSGWLPETKIRQISHELLAKTAALEKGVRLLGLGVSGWWKENKSQLELFE